MQGRCKMAQNLRAVDGEQPAAARALQVCHHCFRVCQVPNGLILRKVIKDKQRGECCELDH